MTIPMPLTAKDLKKDPPNSLVSIVLKGQDQSYIQFNLCTEHLLYMRNMLSTGGNTKVS